MSTAAERAADRLRRFAERHGDAAQLARLVSLAVRVDAPLLRALRLRFLPQTDAGIEADLWFSPLTESVSSQGFVFDRHVAELLQRGLAAEKAGGEQALLDAAAGLVDALHRDWPPSLRLEERVTWLALKDAAGAAGEIESLLRQAAAAMAADETRGMEIARWAQRALPRLPPAAQKSESALLLALGAVERLGGRTVLSLDGAQGAALEHAAWILPPQSRSQRTEIGVRRYAEGLEFVEPENAPAKISLPKTTPLYLQVSWTENGQRLAQAVSVQPGRRLAVPPQASDIQLRTLAGEAFALSESAAPSAEQAQATQAPIDLFRACVGVEFVFPDRDGELVVRTTGFFVSRAFVLTQYGQGGEDAPDRGKWRVHYGDRVVPAEFHAEDGGLALLRLDAEIPDPIVLPRATGVKPGDTWESASFSARHLVRIRGRVVAVIAPSRRLELELADTDDTQEMARAGAPVVVEGQIVGQLSTSDVNRGVLYAVSMARINAFVERALPPARLEPAVFVSTGQRTFPPGATEGGDPIERLRRAMSAARLRPVVGVEQTERGESSPVSGINSSAGAAIVLSPWLLKSDSSNRELMSIAYRRWGKRDYPVLICQLPGAGIGDFRLPPPLTQIDAASIEKASDAELLGMVRQVFAPLAAPRDDTWRQSAVGGELRDLLAKKHVKRDADATVRAILARGMFAEIDWQDWLGPLLGDDDGKAVVQGAAMFSLPPNLAPMVRAAAERPPGKRALCLNAMPVNIAIALIDRAWLGEIAPTTLVFREQQWPESDHENYFRSRVRKEVQSALECDEETADWLLLNISAPLYLIFATRPLPSLGYIEKLQRALPHAVLFFLGAREPDRTPIAEGLVTELPPLTREQEDDFLQHYKRLMRIVAPKAASEGQMAKRKAPESRQAPETRKAAPEMRKAAPEMRKAESSSAPEQRQRAKPSKKARPKRKK